MLAFFWILGAMGVAWAARQGGRHTGLWFILGVVLTPLGGSVALTLANRYGIFRGK